MSEHCLLVLGASRYQLEVIKTAKDLGYRVVTTDNVPGNPGHALAHKSYSVDTTNLQEVLEVARREGVTGVLSPCTDVAVPTAAYVANALGLPGIPFESARSLTSKISFREFLIREGLPCPRFQVLADVAATETTDPVGFPAIVKPEGSSGSKGIFIVRSREELRERLPATLDFSPVKKALLEQLIEGRQGTCEGIVVDGKVAFSLLTDRETAPAPFVATAAHLVPSRLLPAERERIVNQIQVILTAHGVRSSPFDCDFVIDPNGIPYVLELTPRLGGNSLNRLVHESTGVHLAEVAVHLACGSAIVLPAELAVRPTAQLIFGVPSAGKLSFDQDEAASLRGSDWVRDLSFDYPVGHPVAAFINGRHRVGEATLVGESRDDVDAKVSELRARLRIAALP